MKVLHLTRRFLPGVGGIENYIYETAKRLDDKGVKSRVLTLDYDMLDKKVRYLKKENIENIEIVRIPGFGYYKKPLPLSIPVSQFAWADIVHVHDVRFLFETTVMLKKLLKLKVVYTTHGFLLHTKDAKLIKNIAIPLYYKPVIAGCVNAVICVSEQDYDYFKSWKAKKLFLIENGVDMGYYKQIGRAPRAGTLLYFGRIDRNKGIDNLFKTLEKLKEIDWELYIAGSGFPSYRDELVKLATDLGIAPRIKWKGIVSNNELKELLHCAQLCLFPSRYEGFGFTLVEAMAAGCCCVANEIPTYRKIIRENENGFIVDFENHAVAAAKLKNVLLQAENELAAIGSSGQQSVEGYDWKRKIDQIEEVYRSVL